MSVEVLVLPLHEPAKPPFLFPAAMRHGLPNRPAMHHAQQAEPEFVEFANHNFLLNNDAEDVGDFGGEFDVIAQIPFRLRAVVLPQFREGFAIAVFRADAKMLGN